MSEINCPICQRPNDANAERCWYCHALLSAESQPDKDNGTDFLQSLRDESETSSEPFIANENSQQENNVPEEVPDWLARIRAREQQERENQSIETPVPEEEPAAPAEKEEMPEWLLEIKAGNSGKKKTEVEPSELEPFLGSEIPAPEEPVDDSNKQDDTEEWLKRLASWKPQPEENTFQSQVRSTPLTEKEEIEKAPQGLNIFEGWQKLTPEPQISAVEDTPSTKARSEDQIQEPNADLEPDEFDMDAIRDSFSDQDSKTFELAKAADTANDDPVIASEENLDRIFDEEISEESKPQQVETNPFTEELPDFASFMKDDLPDWLATATLETTTHKPAEPVSEEIDLNQLKSDTKKNNMPAWLQSMRPDTTNILSENEPAQSVETDGLLAGIAGALPGTIYGEGYRRKPLGFGSGLKVSEHQKANAGLLAALMEEPLEDERTQKESVIKIKPIVWRLILGTALILLILFSDLLPQQWVIQPVLFPPEVVSLYNQINNIPIEQPVLITGDFDPASVGELELSTSTLLENLIRRGQNIAVLSNNPAGATILMDQLSKIGQNIPGFDLSTRVINLGYLPGGSTGLSLMTNNLRAAVPHSYDMYDIPATWNSYILQSVQSLNDFAAILVISDKAENARVWVEQLQPGLMKTPLLFVVSAQAAPMIEPYYQSGQISGYLAGYSGEVNYHKIFQQSENGTEHLGAFQSSLLMIAFLLLAGGIINMFTHTKKR